jgi:hypothetical protein
MTGLLPLLSKGNGGGYGRFLILNEKSAQTRALGLFQAVQYFLHFVWNVVIGLEHGKTPQEAAVRLRSDSTPDEA